MESLLFVSTFPTEANKLDGYFRRVYSVDQVFKDRKRIHLDIRFQKNFRKKIEQVDLNMQVIHVNAILHFFLIGSILRKSGIIYIHSVAKVTSILIHLIRLKKIVPFALDLHGVMIEEQQLAGKPLKAWFYSGIEKFCFKYSSLNIYVSEVMQSHFRAKYPHFSGDEVIFATNSNQQLEAEIPVIKTGNSEQSGDPGIPGRQRLKKTLNITDNDVVFVYSGNCQPWQNIELMLQTMEKLTASHIKFLILSGQKRRFEHLVRRYHIPTERIMVVSVKPEELESYYELAHYGFILRDDILVNRVANPTKLAEYLKYGLIPVVKLVDIGDYARFDYEYVGYRELNTRLLPKKSQKNRQIFDTISKTYGSEPLQDAISRIQKRYITPTKA